MSFYENIAGFLFCPYRQSLRLLESKSHSFTRTFLFVLYGAFILSVIAVFFFLYPEVLYYGVSFETPFQNLPFISLSQPVILLGLLVIFMLTLIGLHFLLIGLGNYFIGGILSRNKISRTQAKKYLTVYGFSSMLPLLLLGVCAIFWMYFFEKLYFATDISPFIDFTIPTIILFGVIVGFMTWKWIIETRINQAFFKTSLIRGVIPELVQVFLFVGFFLFINFLLNLFVSSIGWV